jgi:signal transduction histidine kinase
MKMLMTNGSDAPTSTPIPVDPVFPSVPPGPAAGVLASTTVIATEHGQPRQPEMLDIVAHEMRNALQPIRLAAALLGRTVDGDAQLPRLRLMIERQVAHMSRLVDDLLDVSRARHGKLRLECMAVDVGDVVAQATDACQGCVVSRDQHLRTELPARPLTVHGDPVRLVQVLGNLLANASKYTPRGGAITVSAEPRHGTLQLTVADNGIGIAPEVLPHVFEPFVQDAHAVSFDGAGLGIGLSVVRDLVEAHGGHIVARSAGHGRGSQFVVTLPLAGQAGTAAAEQMPAAATAGEPATTAGQRVARHLRIVA